MKGIFYLLTRHDCAAEELVVSKETIKEFLPHVAEARIGHRHPFTGQTGLALDITQFVNGFPTKRVMCWDGQKTRRLEWDKIEPPRRTK